MKKKYLEAGYAVNTHGVRGAVRLESRCNSPEVLASIKTLYLQENGEYLPVTVAEASVHKGMVLLTPLGSTCFEDAVKYKKRVFYADRDDIPRGEGDFFIADLLDLPIIDADSGRVYGKLRDVSNTGASDIYEIDCGETTAYMPAVPEFVIRIDTENGIYIRPIEGMFP